MSSPEGFTETRFTEAVAMTFAGYNLWAILVAAAAAIARQTLRELLYVHRKDDPSHVRH